MTTPAPDKKTGALELLKGFLAEHPELISEITAAAAELAAGPPTPLTLFGVVHEMIDAFHGPIDMERRAQMHAAVDEHQAQVAELVQAAHTHQAAPAAPAPAAASPAADPAPAAPSSPSSDALPLDSDPVTG